MSVAIGIDLGGTKIEILALDEAGRELMRRRRPTPRDSYEGTIEAIASLVEEVEAKLGARATVGLGHPGAISPASGLLKNANSVWLNGRPLDRDVQARLGRPVALANDANCLALSEATDGAGASAEVLFAVIIGTGTGAGIAMRRRIIVGPHAIAGEWGHNPLPWPKDEERPGPACYCGLNGCLETWISGTGFAADHRRRTGQKLSGPEIVAAADQGEPAAQETLALYIDRLGRALATIINVLDPDVIVLGGGMSNVESIYDSVPDVLRRYVFSDTVRTRIVPAAYGDSSGVRGAAWLGRGITC